MARLKEYYKDTVVKELTKQFSYKNPMQVPRLEKIVISMGLGKAMTGGEKVKMEQAEKELSLTAQRRSAEEFAALVRTGARPPRVPVRLRIKR